MRPRQQEHALGPRAVANNSIPPAWRFPPGFAKPPFDTILSSFTAVNSNRSDPYSGQWKGLKTSGYGSAAEYKHPHFLPSTSSLE